MIAKRPCRVVSERAAVQHTPNSSYCYVVARSNYREMKKKEKEKEVEDEDEEKEKEALLKYLL